MNESQNFENGQPQWSGQSAWQVPPPPKRETLPAGRRETIFAAFLLIFAVLTVNSLVYAGMYLGFSLGFCGILLLSFVYMTGKGMKPGVYSFFCAGASFVLAASILWSNNGILTLGFFLLAVFSWFLSLSICMRANVHPVGGFSSLQDALRVGFSLTYPKMGAATRGLFRREGRKKNKAALGVLGGCLLAIPVLFFFLLPLLRQSDAAFDSLMEQALSGFTNWRQLIWSLLLGVMLFFPLYTRAVYLRRRETADMPAPARPGSFTVPVLGGFLGAIALVYGLYLFSQLAYFFNAFSGLLPERFTTAEYARRGFFEMAAICAVNLLIVAVSMSNIRKKENRAPGVIRGLCLYLCGFSLLLVISAFSKMSMYVASFGLTYLRVFTSLFMCCLAVAFVAVGVWIFCPRFPYMKCVAVFTLTVACLTAWVNVDAVVARYNVTAFEKGRLETVDMDTLAELNCGVVPYLIRLSENPDPEVSARADELLADWTRWYYYVRETDGNITLEAKRSDLRSWTFQSAQAEKLVTQWAETHTRALSFTYRR